MTLAEFCDDKIAELEEMIIVAMEEGDDDLASYLEGAIDAYSVTKAKYGEVA
jgi:hypothetical protein